MPNIPYETTEGYEPKRVIDAILARRGSQGLMNLDRMLLNSPPVAEGWNAFLGSIRGALVLDGRLRELAICAVAVLNGADYELHHHRPLWIREGGTDEQAAALVTLGADAAERPCFDASERAVLALATQMTRDIKVRPETLSDLKACMPSTRHVFELIAVVAVYNMVSRVLVSTGVEIESA